MGKFQSKEFLNLQRVWYDKLREDGFEDIEITDWRTGESGNLLHGPNAMDIYRTYTPEQEEYFATCRAYLRQLEEENIDQTDLLCFSMHAEGYSFYEIETIAKIPRKRASKIVTRLLQNMSLNEPREHSQGVISLEYSSAEDEDFGNEGEK